jgi:hypothetical protein
MNTKPLSEMTYKERMKDSSLSMFQKLYGKNEEDIKNHLVHVLHEHGIYKIEATYSGGHDEGGVDELKAWDKDGVEVEWKETAPDAWQDPVWEACNDVLTTKFFSWALGCSVYGMLHVDMGERRVWTEGEIEEYVPDKEPLDWTL